MPGPVAAAATRATVLRALGWAAAALLLAGGVHQWYDLNSYARTAAENPAVPATVTHRDPVTVALDTGPLARDADGGTPVVRGAPDHLHPGDVIAVLPDPRHPGRVYYAAEGTGATDAARAAGWLLGLGAAAWLAAAAAVARVPSRRRVRGTLAAAGHARAGVVLAVTAPPRRGWRARVGPPVAILTVAHPDPDPGADAGPDTGSDAGGRVDYPVTGRRWPAVGDSVHVAGPGPVATVWAAGDAGPLWWGHDPTTGGR